jgi:uncharacterized protein
MALQDHLDVSSETIRAFCAKWNVGELALFGSVLRDDFSPESDVDVLVAFAPGTRRSLFDLVEMKDELSDLLGRKVDLVSREGLRNPFRRHQILTTRQILYAA